MMAKTTAQSFTEFAGKLVPTLIQSAMIESRHRIVEEQLREAFGPDSSMPVLDVRKIGSVDRGTIIRPLHDVDLMAVFDPDVFTFAFRFFGSRDFITRVRNALNDSTATIVGTRGQAVRIFYAKGPMVDIAPVFPIRGGGYWIPNGRNGWLKTDPDLHKRWIGERHAALHRHLKPFARLVKRWNRVHSERLSSFHIEVMVANTFGTIGANSRATAARFFDWGARQLHCRDPAGHSGDLASKLTRDQQRAILQSFAAAKERAERANSAEQAGNHAEAIRLWRIIFGEEFPSYG
jgi:hypothetical protein